MEAHPAEHVHTMGQRAPQVDQPEYQQPGVGSVRRPSVDRAHRDSRPEADAEVQQATDVPVTEAGKRLGGAQVPGERGHSHR